MTLTQVPARSVDSPTANQLGEVILVKRDLEEAIAAMTLRAELGSPAPEDQKAGLIYSSLWRAAIIQFIGCFDRSAPHCLSKEQVYEGIEGGLEYFAWLEGTRHRWAAHRVGPLHQGACGVLIHPENGDWCGVAILEAKHLGPEGEDNLQVAAFMSIALRYIVDLGAQLEHQLRAEVEAMPVTRRLRLPPSRIYGTDPSDVHYGRRKFRNIARERVRKKLRAERVQDSSDS